MLGISTVRSVLLLMTVVLGAFSFSLPTWALGSTPVTVVNPGDIAKAEGIQQPYQANVSCTFGQAFPFNNSCDTNFGTPSSQRLVIEFVSGQCPLEANNIVTEAAILTTVGGGGTIRHYLSVQQPSSQPSTISQPVRIYADPSSTIFFEVITLNPNKFGCQFSVSGQAITVP
jgi:hypothetical protein